MSKVVKAQNLNNHSEDVYAPIKQPDPIKLRIGVFGPLDFVDYERFKRIVDGWLQRVLSTTHAGLKENEFVFVGGGVKGVDRLLEIYCAEKRYLLNAYRPDWEKYPGDANKQRNRNMCRQANSILIFFWANKQHDIDIVPGLECARKQELNVTIFNL